MRHVGTRIRELEFRSYGPGRAGRFTPGKAMDMWTMRLRRTGLGRGQRAALPTADPFDHMPTASHQEIKHYRITRR